MKNPEARINSCGVHRAFPARPLGSPTCPLRCSSWSALAWGTPEPGAETLGRALISATLGGRAADDHLVELFVKEVIGSLSPAGFELSATEIERWLRRQLGGQPA
jgi:hypothetical protein